MRFNLFLNHQNYVFLQNINQEESPDNVISSEMTLRTAAEIWRKQSAEKWKVQEFKKKMQNYWERKESIISC